MTLMLFSYRGVCVFFIVEWSIVYEVYLSVCWRFFFFKQKTAYEMRISDWSSDVCSSDLTDRIGAGLRIGLRRDEIDQRLGEVRHVGQLGPGPLQAGSELRHEMAHAGLAAGDAVGLEEAHLRPAQADRKSTRLNSSH